METTTLPASCVGQRAGRSTTALSQGVATTTKSASAAPALSRRAAAGPPSRSPHRSARAPATVRRPLGVARADRDVHPRRPPDAPPRPRPAGPVPPRIPTCMAQLSHRCSGGPHRRPVRVASPPMGMLDGKRILVTGVLTDASLAFAVARLAQEEGAEVVLSGAGRGLSLTRRTARKLPVRTRGARDRRASDPSSLPPPARRWPHGGTAWTACSTPSASPRAVPGLGDVRRRLGRRVGGPGGLGLLAEGAGGALPAAARGGRGRRRGVGGGAGLRRHRGLAPLRLDGGGQGGPRVADPVPGPGPRAAGDPGQPGGRRAGAHHGRQVDPRVRRLRGHLGRPGRRSAGTSTTPTWWPGPAWRCCPTGCP